jgi:two-component sensor histidine kinase
LYLNAQINNFIALVSLLVLFHSCSRFDLDDYIFDDLPTKTEAQLQSMADTSWTLPRIAELSKRRQVDTLIFYAEWLKDYNEDMALWYAQKAYDLATEKNWDVPRGVSANRIARIKGQRAEYGEDLEDAMVDAKISKRLLQSDNNAYWEVDMNNLFGSLFKSDEELDSARLYFERASQKINEVNTKKHDLDSEKGMILVNLALTYPMEDTVNQNLFYRQSDSLFQLGGDKENRARLWQIWATSYRYNQEFEKADSLLDLCIEYCRDNNNLKLLSLAYQEKGVLNYSKFRYSKNIEHFDLALQFFNQNLDLRNDNRFEIYDVMGRLFHASWGNYMPNSDSHVDSAIYYYKRAFEDARESGAIRTMKVLSRNIAKLYNSGEKIDRSIIGSNFEVFLDKNYAGVVDTLKRKSQTAYQRINQVEQRDIQVSAANKRKNQLRISFGVLLVAGMIFIFVLQRQQNRRLKAEMDALRAQINPHFISNSLNAIESLVNLGNTKAASKYLVHFSRLSRQILTGSRTSMTSLSSELKTLDHFLALEQLRFRDKLTYNIELDPDIDGALVEVPAMILQPYAENAIWHGIKPKPEGGHVQVGVRKEGKVLVFIVEDNGIGREQSRALKQASVMKHKSMGMKITEDRIKAMGRVKGSQVEIQDLKDAAGNAAGTRVIIRLPYKSM